MSIRVTPLQAIQSGGLRGFGFSVFIDRDADTPSPEAANEVPAQDGGGNELGESLLGKSKAARPASVDAHVNDGRLAGEISNEVVTGGESAAPHSEQKRASSRATAADPVATSLGAGSADQFNDTGPHVFSDQEPG